MRKNVLYKVVKVAKVAQIQEHVLSLHHLSMLKSALSSVQH